MSEQFNPFEQAMNMPGNGGTDLFAGIVPDPFGLASPAPDPVTPPVPGDLQAAPTLFGTVETSTDNDTETQAIAKAPAQIIDLGNQPEAVSPFEETEAPNTPVKVIDGGQLNVLEPKPASANVDQTPVVVSQETDAESNPNVVTNPLAEVLAGQDKTVQQSIFTKLPIFEHGAVKEPIEDLEQTFEDLRLAKSDDFPELEDGIRVSWDVVYGKVRKSVPTPKKTKIGEFKKSIETSKEFTDALKKDKDKSPDCIIKPRITAQSKGEKLPLPAYKGLFTNLQDAEASGKVITIVPGRDGKVYEIRREEAGTFITPSGECGELSDIEAGFIPALPLIPRERLLEILGFFRSLMQDGYNYEAIANIYWDREHEEFITVIPKQCVTATRADSELTDEYGPERYIHYMDIHSHNIMPAMFSSQDDRDEKATRLYAVIGRLNRYLPEMDLRLSNGGKFLALDPRIVFESLDDFYPASWHDKIESGIRDNTDDYAGIRNYMTCLELVCAS